MGVSIRDRSETVSVVGESYCHLHIVESPKAARISLVAEYYLGAAVRLDFDPRVVRVFACLLKTTVIFQIL